MMFAFLGVVFFTAPSVFAETIVLKSGETVNGTITEKKGNYIKIASQGELLLFVLEEIDTVDGQKVQVPKPPAPPVRNNSNWEINKGKNRFVAEVGSDYRKKLRIYGINDADQQGWSPLAYATYFLAASPFTGNTQSCERTDAQNSAILNVIVESKDVISKLAQLKAMHGRKRATLIGKDVAIKQFYFEGQDHSSVLQPQGQLDPRRALLVTDIIEIEE